MVYTRKTGGRGRGGGEEGKGFGATNAINNFQLESPRLIAVSLSGPQRFIEQTLVETTIAVAPVAKIDRSLAVCNTGDRWEENVASLTDTDTVSFLVSSASSYLSAWNIWRVSTIVSCCWGNCLFANLWTRGQTSVLEGAILFDYCAKTYVWGWRNLYDARCVRKRKYNDFRCEKNERKL